MRYVNKGVFIRALTCPYLAWLIRNGEIHNVFSKKMTPADELRRDEGIEVGKRARELYSDGELISVTEISEAINKTQALIEDPNVSVIFEGTFLVCDLIAKPDILVKVNGGWDVIEVKASVNLRQEHIDDLSYTTMVVKCSGLTISKTSLMFISRGYRLEMNDEDLFVKEEHTGDVFNRVKEFESLWKQIDHITSTPSEPNPQLCYECRKCDYFKDCIGKDIANHIFEIPRLGQKKFDELAGLGIFSIESIPSDFPLSATQLIVRDSIQSGKPYLKLSLKDALKEIVYPAYYLDFETVSTAIPLHSNIAPYAKIPVIYSIHKCLVPGKIDDHYEYFSDPGRDCRIELAKSLLSNLSTEGSIIVYHKSFEIGIINDLRNVCSEFSKELNRLIDRIIDLEEITKGYYYHPEFYGSYSIKNVLPVLVPGMSYEGLAISEGDSASALYAYLALGRYDDPDESDKLKTNLLEYCKQDTLAMVKLHEKFLQLV